MQVTTETMYYLADSRASRVTAQVFSGGLLSAFGHNPTIRIRDFLCEAEVDLDHIERSALKVTVRTAALSVQDELSDKDRALILEYAKNYLDYTEIYLGEPVAETSS